MPRGMRFGNNDGRVDRSGAGERARRAARYSEGEEAWLDSEPYPHRTVRRSSRATDPERVETGLQLALFTLVKTGDYTTDELARIFNLSRATIYRHLNELRKLCEYYPVIERLVNEGFFDDWDEVSNDA
jgi:DNA-binding CsgD family transcriptional regulator